MWKSPWKYSEGIAIVFVIFIVGIVLQFCIGAINLAQFKYPTNLIFGGIYVVLLIILTFIGQKNKYIDWFSRFEAAFTSFGMFLVMLIIMGITRQEVALEVLGNKYIGWQWDLGFHQMTSSWVFELQFIYFMSILGMVTIKQLIHFKWGKFIFILNHLGLFIALFAGIFGSSDIQKVRIQTELMKPNCRGISKTNELVKLPIAIELKEFKITQYPPKLFLVSNQTGEVQPVNKPESFLVESTPRKSKLLGWDIEATEFLPMAESKYISSKNNTIFLPFDSIGATSAVYVKAHNGTICKEGWVTCGNYMFPSNILTLDKNYSIVMPEREPKQFSSLVNIYIENEEKVGATIEVNKPFSVAGWKIYQLSYDEAMGRWSNKSVFELVRDPWLPYVYLGISMMLLGALGLFFIANKKR